MRLREIFQENGVWFVGGKAANAGGVATSALEMSQNSERLSWTFEEVDAKSEIQGFIVWRLRPLCCNWHSCRTMRKWQNEQRLRDRRQCKED